MSLGTGRPMTLRDENTIKHSHLLLSHAMSSPTDIRLVAQVQLVAKKSTQAPLPLPFFFVLSQAVTLPTLIAQIHDTLTTTMHGQGGTVTSSTLAFVRRANEDLDQWYYEFDEMHSE